MFKAGIKGMSDMAKFIYKFFIIEDADISYE